MICVKVRAYTGQGFGSGFIQKFTRGKASHVSLIFDMGHCVVEVEAIQGKGVIVHPPHSKATKAYYELSVPLTYEQVIDAHAFATSVEGAKYDWLGVFSFALHRKKHSLNKFFCSELVAYTLLKVGYPVSRREPYKESPASVVESLRLLSADL